MTLGFVFVALAVYGLFKGKLLAACLAALCAIGTWWGMRKMTKAEAEHTANTTPKG